MNCSKIQNLLSAYMDGELTGVEQLTIRRHLDVCEACANEHDSLLTAKRMISTLSIRQPRPELEQMILDALAHEETGGRRKNILPTFTSWWLTLPLNRRLQFAGVFAVLAIGLATVRILPVLFTSERDQTPAARYIAQTEPVTRDVSPVADVIFVHNPTHSAPVSSGPAAMPVAESPYQTVGLR